MFLWIICSVIGRKEIGDIQSSISSSIVRHCRKLRVEGEDFIMVSNTEIINKGLEKAQLRL